MAIGLALDAVSSAARGAIDTDSLASIIATIRALGLPTYHAALDLETDGRRPALEGMPPDVDRELLLCAIDWLRHAQ